MNARALVMVSLAAAFPVALELEAQGLSKWVSSAVDAKGVRHQESGYPKKHAPWMDDAIKTVKPDYSYTDKARRNAGFGLYRATLDLKTGSVTKVAVIQSTGVPTLDDSATSALRQWQWKPGKWKEIDVPISFVPFGR